MKLHIILLDNKTRFTSFCVLFDGATPKLTQRRLVRICYGMLLGLCTVKPRLSGMHLTPLSGRFFSGTQKRNVIVLHLAGNPCFRNRTVVLGTKPCFTMTICPCYPDTRPSVIDFKANWHYKHCVAYPCLIGDLITFVNR